MFEFSASGKGCFMLVLCVSQYSHGYNLISYLPLWCYSLHPRVRLALRLLERFLTQGLAADPPATLYMGRDKVESWFECIWPWAVYNIDVSSDEELIRYAWPQDVWFHVDKLSSAHVYLRMPHGMVWESIPEALLIDCAQLVKANSIEGVICNLVHGDLITSQGTGNKKDNLTIIYTPGDNLKVCLLPFIHRLYSGLCL